MNTKAFLALLVSATLMINYYNYLDSDDAKLASGIAMLKNRIVREERLQAEVAAGGAARSVRSTEGLLFPASLNPTAALGKVQKLIEAAAEASGIEVANISWGEPFVLPNAAVRVLPIRFNGSGKPFQLGRFAAALQAQKELVRPEGMTLSLKQREGVLSLQMQLQAFQRVSDAK